MVRNLEINKQRNLFVDGPFVSGLIDMLTQGSHFVAYHLLNMPMFQKY